MPAFPPLGFVALFAGLWIGISFLMSRMSGWNALAQRYRAVDEPSGERLTWIRAQLGGVSFRSSLNLTLGADGLFMVPALPFKTFMPLLLIPWSDVSFEGFTTFFFFKLACLRLGGKDGPLLSVYPRTAARLLPRLSESARQDHAAKKTFDGNVVDPRILVAAVAIAVLGLVVGIVLPFALKR